MESHTKMVAQEGNKLPTQEFKRIEKLTKLKRELSAVLNQNGIDSLLGLRDRVIAEYLVRSLMALSKVIDDRNELDR